MRGKTQAVASTTPSERALWKTPNQLEKKRLKVRGRRSRREFSPAAFREPGRCCFEKTIKMGRLAEPAQTFRLPNSEGKLQTELNQARKVDRVGHLPERRTGLGSVGRPELRMVKQIEELGRGQPRHRFGEPIGSRSTGEVVDVVDRAADELALAVSELLLLDMRSPGFLLSDFTGVFEDFASAGSA